MAGIATQRNQLSSALTVSNAISVSTTELQSFENILNSKFTTNQNHCERALATGTNGEFSTF